MSFGTLFQIYIGLCKYSAIQNIAMKSPHKPPILTLNAILSHFNVHLLPCLNANQTNILDLIFKYNIVELFMYSTINIDLNVPCYFASIQNMINDYPINKI
jgi:hypothetical protein